MLNAKFKCCIFLVELKPQTRIWFAILQRFHQFHHGLSHLSFLIFYWISYFTLFDANKDYSWMIHLLLLNTVIRWRAAQIHTGLVFLLETQHPNSRQRIGFPYFYWCVASCRYSKTGSISTWFHKRWRQYWKYNFWTILRKNERNRSSSA